MAKESSSHLRAILAEMVPDLPEDPRADLFEGGWLDSLKLVEAIELLEQRLGFEFDADDMSADRFSTLEHFAATVEQARARHRT